MNSKAFTLLGVSGVGMFVFVIALSLAVDTALAEETAAVRSQTTAVQSPLLGPALVIGAALAIGASCVGAGYAVGKVGAAALGVASERPELLTRSLLFVALAEGIAIYGLVIAVMLLRKIS